MKTTEIALVELLDEFSFEQSYRHIPATLASLAAHERVVLVQDDSCEYVVTLECGQALRLWDPEIHWADQATRAFRGTLAEAVTRAESWLASYLSDEGPPEIDAVIAVEAFPDDVLPALAPRRPRKTKEKT